MNIAETTVKTQVQRAYRMLREKLIPILLLISICRKESEIFHKNNKNLCTPFLNKCVLRVNDK
ncbi:MAG: hypothetical protein ACLTZT_03595 [Butyricimonas faecalis]